MPQCKSRLVNCEYCEHWTARKKMRKKRAAQGTNCYGGEEIIWLAFAGKPQGLFPNPLQVIRQGRSERSTQTVWSVPRNSLGAVASSRFERPASTAPSGMCRPLGAVSHNTLAIRSVDAVVCGLRGKRRGKEERNFPQRNREFAIIFSGGLCR